MARRPLPLGTWGRITRTQLGANLWVAKARVRDYDGVTRLVERRTPLDAARDETGAAAEHALMLALSERVTPTSEDLTADSLVSALWTLRRLELESEQKAIRTMDKYVYISGFVVQALGNLRLREVTTQRADTFLRALAKHHGNATAKTARTLLSGMFNLAVRYAALTHNPVGGTSSISTRTKPSRALTVDELKAILRGVATSETILPPVRGSKKTTSKLTLREYAARVDLPDVVTMLAATGCRISEVLGLRWADVDIAAKVLSINGKVVRGKGVGLVREAFPKSEAGGRTLPLPEFAVTMLLRRQVAAVANPHDVVFPSSTGTLRDVDNTLKQWDRVRDALGFEWVTSHTFRKTIATLIDIEGLSARVGADQLGHRQVSMTQDKYMGRGRTHSEVAELMDRTVADQA